MQIFSRPTLNKKKYVYKCSNDKGGGKRGDYQLGPPVKVILRVKHFGVKQLRSKAAEHIY